MIVETEVKGLVLVRLAVRDPKGFLQAAGLLVTLLICCAAQAQTAYSVNSTDDLDDGICDGTHCSLREAILAANASVGLDTISFDIPGIGPHTIQPGSALPTITDPLVIDGYSQPGSAPNTRPCHQPVPRECDLAGRKWR